MAARPSSAPTAIATTGIRLSDIAVWRVATCCEAKLNIRNANALPSRPDTTAAQKLVVLAMLDTEIVLSEWRQHVFIVGGWVIVADAIIALLIAGMVIQIRRRQRSEKEPV